MVDLNFYHPGELKERTEDKIEPLWSQFDLTYNSVLNLTARYETPGQIQDVLERNLLVYQNQARYQRLQDEIVELSREALSLKEARCPHHRQDSCIEAVKKARRQVDKLHKELANMRGIGKKGRRQQILRQLHQLGEKTQPPSIHRCGKRERESCLYRERQIRRKERRSAGNKKGHATYPYTGAAL
jgi:superfamily II RNA helicase